MGSEGGPSTTAGSPDSAELFKVLRRLAHEQDRRGVIRLVERWAELGELPREARIEEAKAFLDLRLMDRAWVRLKELTEQNADDLDALLLIARLYVDRGWPARARRALDRLSTLGCPASELAELSRRADQPPLEPPSDAREVERGGSPAQLLALAEVFLATGSFLRARSLLERVRRANPTNLRAELLLWGIQGEFVRRGESLSDLLRELNPPEVLDDVEDGDWDTAEHTDVGATDEGGTEAPTTEVAVAQEERESAQFPSLFRRPAQDGPEAEDDDEPTVASMLASADDLKEPLPDAGTDPGDGSATQGGDTQIMSILPGPGRGLAPVEGPIHRPREGAGAGPAVLEPLDLRAWQRSMGLGAKDSQIPLERDDAPSEDFLEDEDQDIVVMTRREVPEEEPAPVTPAQRKPIEVVEKYPQPLVQPAAARPATPLQPVQAPEQPAFVDDDSLPAAPTDWGRMIIVVALTAGLLVGTGMLLFQGVQRFAADRILDESERVAAQGLAEPLISLHERLVGEIAAGSPPRWARQLAAAHAALALWEQDGDESLRDEARSRLADAKDAPIHASAELSAALALASGDVTRASKLVQSTDLDRIGARALATRVALESGDASRAQELWQPVAEQADGVAHRLLWSDVLVANGRMEEAQTLRAALVQQHGEEPLVFLARQEQAWEGTDPVARLSAVERWLEARADQIFPRNRARAQVLRADLLMRQGLVEQAAYAIALAIEADPTYAPALYRRAGWSAYGGDTRAALLDLERCLDGRPGDFDCRRGLVQIHLTEGQRMEAAEVVREDIDPQGDALLRAWLAAAAGETQRALELAPEPPAGEGPPLTWMVRATAMRGVGGGEAERDRAVELFASAIDPLDRLLLFALEEGSVPSLVEPAPTELAPADPARP